MVTVAFVDARSVDFLAGHGYRLASISVSARYDGNDDKLEGGYVVVMFENDTTAIISGREQYGIPKVYADISPVRTVDQQHLRCEASLWGHLILGIDVATPLKSQNAVIRKAAARRSSNNAILGYKYIPAVDGPPDADYPMVMWVDYQFDDLWLGSAGELYFGEVSRQDISYFHPLVEALKSLPIRSVVMTSRARGSQVQRSDKCRRLT
jgi:acetoacetate decarboxylase